MLPGKARGIKHIATYVQWIKRLILFHNQTHPAEARWIRNSLSPRIPLRTITSSFFYPVNPVILSNFSLAPFCPVINPAVGGAECEIPQKAGRGLAVPSLFPANCFCHFFPSLKPPASSLKNLAHQAHPANDRPPLPAYIRAL